MEKSPAVLFVEDIIEGNGKTVKENNLEKRHNIPLGTLVEVKFDNWFGDGACWKIHARLWVVIHTRDCDGSPMYTLSRWNLVEFEMYCNLYGIEPSAHGGITEDQLTVIEVTDKIKQGEGCLEWESEAMKSNTLNK
ncbi:MAG: hypothetical protein GY928_34170 [Colwellia sp.]|nr:hypothetical protein [Colwellia sp.]